MSIWELLEKIKTKILWLRFCFRCVSMFLEHVAYVNANSRRWGRDEEEEEEGLGESKANNNGGGEMWSLGWII